MSSINSLVAEQRNIQNKQDEENQVEVKSNASPVHKLQILKLITVDKEIEIFFLALRAQNGLRTLTRNYSHVNCMHKQVQSNKKWQFFNKGK